MPIWGEKIDKEVQRYLRGCLELSIGNLHWRYDQIANPHYIQALANQYGNFSYATGRYLGKDGPEVRATRQLRLDS